MLLFVLLSIPFLFPYILFSTSTVFMVGVSVYFLLVSSYDFSFIFIFQMPCFICPLLFSRIKSAAVEFSLFWGRRGTGVSTQSLLLARYVLCHLSHIPFPVLTLFCFFFGTRA
jgi:hypothetical protein